MQLTTIKLRAPYLVFFGDVREHKNAKTGLGIAYWAPDRCLGQMKLAGCTVESGLPNLSIREALQNGVQTVIVGVAPTGGRLEESWLPSLLEFARAGVDIASGLHSKLADIPDLVKASRAGGGRLIDVRVPPVNLPCGLGRRRSGKRVLTVGTDCAVGKKYTALALHRELKRRDIDATFRATGQTGIMIAGEGIPIDAVVGDFIAGAAETLSPDNAGDHWDIIEGQGSLIHPAYAGVALGLIHGSQPDALIVCHEAGREVIQDVDRVVTIPPLGDFVERVLLAARVTNPECVCAGLSINTSSLAVTDRGPFLAELRQQTGLPVVDPISTGIDPLADALQARRI